MSEQLKVYEQELASGIFPLMGTRQPIFWSDGRNIVFQDGSVKAGLGQFGMFYSKVASRIVGIKSTHQAGKDTIYYFTKSVAKKWTLEDGVVDVTPALGFTGTNADLFSFARWGQWMVCSNGVDGLFVDKNDGNGFVPLTTPFSYAKIIYGTDTQLIAMNTSEGTEDIEWCDVDDLENWTPLPSNFAGSKLQRNLDSPIISAKALGQNLAIYTKNEMLGMSFIGAPYVFSIVPLLEGFGIAGLLGVTTVGNLHYGIGRKFLWTTDGTNVKAIDAPAIHDFVYGNSPHRMDPDYAHQACAWHDQIQNSVVFYYTPLGEISNTIGVAYNYVEKTWTAYDFGRSYVDDSGLFPYAISGDDQGNIYQQATVATPPATKLPGVLDVSTPESSFEYSFGDLGFGDLGFGGSYDVTG